MTLFPHDEPQHDPGGKVRLKLQSGVVGWAHFSDCRRYRHELGRYWGSSPDEFSLEPYALWIGMNPSTAEAHVDDPTVRREINFTRSWGMSCYVKCNVMDYRATKPAALLAPGVDPCSSVNLDTIRSHAKMAARIIVCFGVLFPKIQHYADRVVGALQAEGHDLWCLGLTDGGHPRHPLYVKGDTPLRHFEGTA